MSKAKSGKMQYSKIVPDTGINKQPDQAITMPGRVQNPIAGMGTSDPFEPLALEPYGGMETPPSRDLDIKRSSGAGMGPDIKTQTTGKTGEKAK